MGRQAMDRWSVYGLAILAAVVVSSCGGGGQQPTGGAPSGPGAAAGTVSISEKEWMITDLPATVKAAHELGSFLGGRGLDAAIYHGRLPAPERTRVQNAFMQTESPRVMVGLRPCGCASRTIPLAAASVHATSI